MSTFTANVNVVEQRIINKIIKAALVRGYTVSVFDGEEYSVKRSDSFKAIQDGIGHTDETTLVMRYGGERVGSILLIHGNDEDVVSDHTDNEAISSLVGF